MAETGHTRFERIQVAPAYQLVAEAIEREVVGGRLLPASRWAPRRNWSASSGSTAPPCARASARWRKAAFIQRGPDRRLYACLPRYNRLSSRVSRALILHEVTFRELFSVALALEVASAEQAVEHISPEMLERLEENQSELEAAAAGDAARMSDLDGTFHHLVAKASSNRVLALRASRPACCSSRRWS